LAAARAAASETPIKALAPSGFILAAVNHPQFLINFALIGDIHAENGRPRASQTFRTAFLTPKPA
jgi:hypothetical protein